MFKRKGASIDTPTIPGVYRPNNPDSVDMTGGRSNPAFVLEPEAGHVDKGQPGSEQADNDSNSSGIASIEENGDGGGGGSSYPGSSGVEPVVVENQAVTPSPGGGDKGKGQPQLKKSINLLTCTAIMVAVTGHSSIFISPASILRLTGSIGASLVVWLIGGLINLGLALCFAELGTMMPQAGGPYAYVLKTFGPLPGFLIMWGYVVLIAGPFWAFLAYTAALYIVKLVFPDCSSDTVETATKVLAGWIMITMVILNCVYMKYVTKIQTFLSGTKLIALLIIIIGGIVKMAEGNTENFENIFEGTTEEPGQFAVAIFYSIFSYGGWQVMTSLMEEVKNPGRDLPMSVYLAFSMVISKYILTNVAYYSLITPQTLLETDAVALMFIRRLYEPLTILISIFVATTSIGALNASIMGHSRLLFAGARLGHMPAIMGMIHTRFLTPWPAIFTLLAWGLAVLYSGSVTDMMEFISLFSTIMGIAVVASLLYLRVKEPNTHRPYRTLLFWPLVQLVVNVAVLILAIYQKPDRMGIGLAILFAGIPVYWLGVLWRSKPAEFTNIVETLTTFAQKL
ncbi:Y+L amino acid transporter 2-like, partial [Littorina saxatilis]|uniref:Y+L amino acid transporter 2-like n=1 Tax=Littorina saxatilis TaxID=31220 RepID=UPI0038B49843